MPCGRVQPASWPGCPHHHIDPWPGGRRTRNLPRSGLPAARAHGRRGIPPPKRHHSTEGYSEPRIAARQPFSDCSTLPESGQKRSEDFSRRSRKNIKIEASALAFASDRRVHHPQCRAAIVKISSQIRCGPEPCGARNETARVHPSPRRCGCCMAVRRPRAAGRTGAVHRRVHVPGCERYGRPGRFKGPQKRD